MIKPQRLQKGDTVTIVSLSRGMLGEKMFRSACCDLFHQKQCAIIALSDGGSYEDVICGCNSGVRFLC